MRLFDLLFTLGCCSNRSTPALTYPPSYLPSAAPDTAGPTGLVYDRCWALVGSDGAALRLKQHPALASICTAIDLERRLLLVSAPGEPQRLEMPLLDPVGGEAGPCSSGDSSAGVQQPPKGSSSSGVASSSGGGRGSLSVRVCSRTTWVQRTATLAGGDAEVAAWFSRVLGVPCRLVQQQQQPCRQEQQQQRGGQGSPVAAESAPVADGGPDLGAGSGQPSSTGGSGSSSSRSFANEGQLLVMGAASLADLAVRSGSAEPAAVFVQRFRCARLVAEMES